MLTLDWVGPKSAVDIAQKWFNKTLEHMLKAQTEAYEKSPFSRKEGEVAQNRVDMFDAWNKPIQR